MKFKDFYDIFTRETIEIFREAPKNNITQDRIVDVWLAHQTIETNKKLVKVTWILAIGTLILSTITIFLTFLQEALNLQS